MTIPTTIVGSPPHRPPKRARWITHWITARANLLRELFDFVAERAGAPWLVALVPVIVTGGVAMWLRSALGRTCTPLPVSLVRLEVSYSAPRFAALLGAEQDCAPRVLATFLPDSIFAVCYGFALCALYIGAERWRRFSPYSFERPEAIVRWRRHIYVLLPLAAAFFDVLENILLSVAGHAIQLGPQAAFPPSVPPLVILGSIASTVKWMTLLVVLVVVLAEVLHGPRGAVVRRLRFSVLAVALGALPLLLLTQGQDILERLVEGAHPFWRVVLGGMLAIVFAATAVWYCGRKLVQLRFEENRYVAALD